jgi:adenylylsulfate kinase
MIDGAVVWFTGLPSSGKSTLATRVRDRLLALGRRAVLLDGDEVREALVPAPTYGDRARDDFYETLSRLGALLARQGVIVLVAATAHRAVYRDRARSLAPRFVEVHVDTPRAACAERDPKGLWAAAQRGQIADLPGAGVPYERPTAPTVIATGGHDDDARDMIVAIFSSETRRET